MTHRGQLGRLRQLAIKMLSAYEVNEPRLTALVHEDNTTFRIDADNGERYVLRIHRPSRKSVAEVHSEMMWLTFLRQNTNLVVPQPVSTRNGNFVTVVGVDGVPEPRMCVLLRWITGRFVNDGLTPTHLERAGAFLAQLHLSTTQFSPPTGFVRGRLDNLYGKPAGITEAVARQQVENPEDEATAVRLVTEFCSLQDGLLVEELIGKIRTVQRAIGYRPEVFGLIHGDFHQWNYLFHQGQVRLIDFDDCGYGHHLYDIAVTIYNIDWKDNASVLRAGFLAGYRQICALSDEHEQYIDTLMALRDLQMMIWAIEMRDHPAFRHKWQEEVTEILNTLKEFVGP
jgi:Ser/Thr protein kinase RdoA (MazF antagonist)